MCPGQFIGFKETAIAASTCSDHFWVIASFLSLVHPTAVLFKSDEHVFGIYPSAHSVPKGLVAVALVYSPRHNRVVIFWRIKPESNDKRTGRSDANRFGLDYLRRYGTIAFLDLCDDGPACLFEHLQMFLERFLSAKQVP